MTANPIRQFPQDAPPQPPTPGGAALALPCADCGTTEGYQPADQSRPARTRGLCAACYDVRYYRGTLPSAWPIAARGVIVQRCGCGAVGDRDDVWLLGRCPACHAAYRARPAVEDPLTPLPRQYPTEPVMRVAPPLPARSWRTAVWTREPDGAFPNLLPLYRAETYPEHREAA